jgi:hypothetical protein
MMFRIVFWDVLLCKMIVDPDDGGSMHLWNVGRQSFSTAVHPRRQFWTVYLLSIGHGHASSIECEICSLSSGFTGLLLQELSLAIHTSISSAIRGI